MDKKVETEFKRITDKVAAGVPLTPEEKEICKAADKRIWIRVLSVTAEVLQRAGQLNVNPARLTENIEEFRDDAIWLAEPIMQLADEVANSYKTWVQELAQENESLRGTVAMLVDEECNKYKN
jgi:hypothetical protein